LLPAITAGLFGANTANVIQVRENVLIIDIGSDQGVEKGMKGKAMRIFIDSTNGEETPLIVGIFIVQKVDKTSSELYLQKLASGAEPAMASRVEFDDNLLSPNDKASMLKKNKGKIIEYITKEAYASAAELIQQSEKLNSGDKELKLLKDGMLLLVADNISVDQYIEFKSKKPNPTILQIAADKLFKTTTDPNLPPEKYLDKNLSLKKNEKGYYEIHPKDKTNHTLVYIPALKLFADKYEVSNAQVARLGIQINPVKFFTNKFKSYPENCPDYPAIVNFDAAEKYSNTLGLRLPSEDEWKTIAGKENGLYSWGDKGPAEGGVYRANFESLTDGYIELAPVNSFESYCSPYGIVNMMGNVCEWIKEGYAKGGDFFSESMDMDITDGKSTDSIYTGFRCVMEAEQ
jgi:formylglycine-generating enzyme required for sulfatase activity